MNAIKSKNPFLRWPLPSLLICLLVGIPFFLSLREFEIDSDARTLLEGDQRNLAAYEKVSAILDDDVVVVVSMAGENLFTQEGFDHLRALCDQLTRLEGLGDVKSLTHSVKPVRRGFSFDFVPFVPSGKLSDEEIEKIRKFSVAHPLVKNIMVAPDAKHTLITCNFKRDLSTPEKQRALRDEIDNLTRPFEKHGYSFKTVALPFVALEIRTTIAKDIKELAVWLTVIVVTLLLIALRSVRLTVLCAVNLAICLALLPGLMRILSVPMTFYSLMLFPLVAGIQLTLMAHLFMGCSKAQREGLGSEEAIARTLNRVLKSCAFATLTTIVGLVSLMQCDVRQVSGFGLIGAAGIALAFVWTFGPGLAMLKLFLGGTRSGASGGSEGAEGDDAVTRTAVRWSQFVNRRRLAIIVIGILGFFVARIGIEQIRTDIRVVEFLDRSSPTRVALQEFEEVYGGINVVQFEIDSGSKNGINNPQFLAYVEKLQGYVDAHPSVSGSYSYAQLIAMMNQIWEGEKEGSFRLPTNPLTLAVFVIALKAQNFPFLSALADEEFQTAIVIVRTHDMLSTEYLKLLEDIVAFAEEGRPEGVRVSAAEGIHSILQADQRIMRAQLESIAVTLCVVGLTLTLLWRSVWLAAVALLVNVVPVGLALSLAGFADIPLNSVTVMVAAIVLSVAVDDAVHFITWWRDELRRTGDSKAALISAFRTKGPPILFTSMILAAVFGAFFVFSFPPVRHFGALSAIAFFGAVISTLVLLPAILDWRRWRALTKDVPESEK